VSEEEMTDTYIDPDETISDDGDAEDWIWEMLGEDGTSTQITCWVHLFSWREDAYVIKTYRTS